ncbi:MAG: YciI family protein [Gemmatimonadales bacterium]
MRFLSVYRAAESDVPPSTELLADMGKLIGEMAEAGVLIATEGCLPTSKGLRIRINDGEFTVTDGPFTEAKEVIGGFALMQVESREEAIEWGKRFLAVVREGESEIRQIAEASDFGPEFTPELRQEEELIRSQLSPKR